MIFANGYANIRHLFEYIVFRYMIFINFLPNLLQLYNKNGIQTLKMIFIKCFDKRNKIVSPKSGVIYSKQFLQRNQLFFGFKFFSNGLKIHFNYHLYLS
jgi:hypothetical protein